MVTTVAYEEVDRLFYERLRRACVAAGLTVDQTLYNDADDYQAARTTLKATLTSQGKMLVDVLGVGSWDDREEMSDARIVVNRTGERPGSIGGSPATFYESYTDNLGATKFKKERYPDMSRDIDYEVRVISSSVIMERVMSTIVTNTLGSRRYAQTVNSSGQFTQNYVTVLSTGGFNMSMLSFIERSYRYTVEDVFIQDPELIATNIAPVNTVEFSLYLPDSQTPIVLPISVAAPNPAHVLPLTIPFNLP